MTIAALPPLHSSAVSVPETPQGTASSQEAGAAFSLELEGLQGEAATPASASAPAGKGSQHGRPDPLQAFEGFVLRTFVEAMLPKENTAFFGSGTAGDIWRSMLAERIGDEIAAAGGVGIAELLAKDPTLASDAQKVLAASEAAEKGAGVAALPSS